MVDDQLTSENIDDAKVAKGIDPIDTLRRVGKEWLSIRVKCSCVGNAACSVCEIEYLLNEIFKLPEYSKR